MSDKKPVRLNKKNVAAALRAAVRKRGKDYNYRDHHETCDYVVPDENDEPTPGCLVGEVLHTSFGIDLYYLEDNCLADQKLADLASCDFITYTPAVEDMLMQAQAIQDVGRTWGEALAAALAA